MATKTPSKKSTPKKEQAAEKASAPQSGAKERIAEDYLVHLIHQAIASQDGPARIADIVREIGEDDISLGLVRHALTSHPSRFLAVDRRWDIATRYADRNRPALRLVQEIVAGYGAPISAWELAHELSILLGRSREGTEGMAERVLASSGHFFGITDKEGVKRYAPISWILDLNDDYHGEEDILFYNYLPADAPAAYTGLKLDWENDPIASAAQVLAKTPGEIKVVDNRLLLFLAWRALGDDYDGSALYQQFLDSGELVLLPEHLWTDQAGLQAIRATLRELAARQAEMPEEEEVETVEAVPLAVSAEDLDEMARIVASSDEVATRAASLVEAVYEIAPGDRTFRTDLETVLAALQADPERFEWVGYDRFRAPGTLPPYIGQVPESLTFPQIPQIETPEGDLLDQMLDDEGFERGLEREILSPIAQDVNDQDPADLTIWPDGVSAESQSLQLVLKAHHKEIGTFPLSQIPPGFFATEPEVVELTWRDQSGAAHEVYADYQTQMLYGLGLFDLYAGIPADSGAIFTLEKTATPGEFLFTHGNETDPDVYVSPERMEQLQNYRAELEAGPTVATHDVVRYILEHSNQAMSFLLLLTELNIVRRTTRRQLASILSGWAGFVHRAGSWSYDAKKAAQGFNKAKRKYVK